MTQNYRDTLLKALNKMDSELSNWQEAVANKVYDYLEEELTKWYEDGFNLEDIGELSEIVYDMIAEDEGPQL